MARLSSTNAFQLEDSPSHAARRAADSGCNHEDSQESIAAPISNEAEVAPRAGGPNPKEPEVAPETESVVTPPTKKGTDSPNHESQEEFFASSPEPEKKPTRKGVLRKPAAKGVAPSETVMKRPAAAGQEITKRKRPAAASEASEVEAISEERQPVKDESEPSEAVVSEENQAGADTDLSEALETKESKKKTGKTDSKNKKKTEDKPKESKQSKKKATDKDKTVLCPNAEYSYKDRSGHWQALGSKICWCHQPDVIEFIFIFISPLKMKNIHIYFIFIIYIIYLYSTLFLYSYPYQNSSTRE